MNTLLSERRDNKQRVSEKKGYLELKISAKDEVIKEYNAKLVKLNGQIKTLQDERQILLTKKENLEFSPYLILFRSVYSDFTNGTEDRELDYDDYWFYDYSKDIIVTKRIYGRSTPNIACLDIRDHLLIDGRLSLEELNNLNLLDSLIQRTIDTLIEDKNPTSWEEVSSLISACIVDGSFFSILYEEANATKLKKDKPE